jgi:hypothetical protein
MAEHKPPQGSSGDKPIPTHAAPPSPRQSETQSQQTQRPPSSASQSSRPTPSDSQKREIVDHFRSQGRQPEDVIWEMQGLKLRLKDLD